MTAPISTRDRHGPFLLPDGRMAATEQVLAILATRHRRQVAQHCEPIGWHRVTGAALYDIDGCLAVLAALPRRSRG